MTAYYQPRHMKNGYMIPGTLRQAVLPLLFSILLVCTVFSPSLGGPDMQGMTLYLQWFIPIIDARYLRYAKKCVLTAYHEYRKREKSCIAISVLAVFLLWILLRGQWTLALKVMTTIYTISYISYMKDSRVSWTLYVATNISIIWAIIQFIAYYIDSDALNVIGPTAIAQAIWGQNAVMTFTNPEGMLYESLGIIRVSGFSREAGFFSSLVISVFLVYILERREAKEKIAAMQIILFVVGMLLSMSRITILAVPLVLIVLASPKLPKFSYPAIIVAWLIAVLLLAVLTSTLGYSDAFRTATDSIIMRNESIGQRFGSPIALADMDLIQLLFGCGNLTNIQSPSLYTEYLISRGFTLCGISQIILCIGILGLGLYFCVLYSFNISPLGVIVVLLSTMTVDPLSAAPFVPLTYWAVYRYKNALASYGMGE